jgi:hypothetical protein
MKATFSVIAAVLLLSAAAQAEPGKVILKKSRRAEAPAPAPVVKKIVPKRKKSRAAFDEISLPLRAAEEIAVPVEQRSEGIMPTPATVQLAVTPVESPIRRSKFKLGLAIQPYRPEGRMELTGLEPYDVSIAGTRPMTSLEFQWLPISFDSIASIAWIEAGMFASVGYARHPMELVSPVGTKVEATEIHSLKAQLGFAASYRPGGMGGALALETRLGAGRLSSLQSSSAPYANTSAGLNFFSAGLVAEYRVWERWAVFAGYDHRMPSGDQPQEIVLQRQNYFAGIWGGFQ